MWLLVMVCTVLTVECLFICSSVCRPVCRGGGNQTERRGLIERKSSSVVSFFGWGGGGVPLHCQCKSKPFIHTPKKGKALKFHRALLCFSKKDL